MKYKRIKKNSDFRKLFDRGKRAYSPCLTLLYYPSDEMKMGIALSKKHGKAVKRNKIKRLARAAFDKVCAVSEKNYSIIILPKVSESYDYLSFEKSLQLCFKKINGCEKD